MDTDKKLDMLRDRIRKCVCSYYGALGVEIPSGEPGNEIVLKLEAEILRQISILWHVGICIVRNPMQKPAIIHDSVTADISEVEYDSDMEYNFIEPNHDMWDIVCNYCSVFQIEVDRTEVRMDVVNNPDLKKSGLAWQASYFISRCGLLSRDKKMRHSQRD